jgi:hypothetical protein
MELLESTDDKSLLLKKTERHKQQLQDEFKSISESTEKIITNALVIGGTLAVTYVIARTFFKAKSKRKTAKRYKPIKDEAEVSDVADVRAQAGIISQIGSALAAQATVFLLDLAKDKLSSYLKTHFEKEAAPKNEHS